MMFSPRDTWTPNRFRSALVTLLLPLAAGCWNGDVSNVRLGDVSLGTQLIDLKRALEEDAITAEEYEAAREKLIALYAICESSESAED
jgi:hypothetical protein